MKKNILILVLVFIAVAVAAGIYFWNQMNRPMYEPGYIKYEQNLRNPLSPPAQTSPATYWTVEPDIQLYHFSKGEGENVLVIHGGPG